MTSPTREQKTRERQNHDFKKDLNHQKKRGRDEPLVLGLTLGRFWALQRRHWGAAEQGPESTNQRTGDEPLVQGGPGAQLAATPTVAKRACPLAS